MSARLRGRNTRARLDVAAAGLIAALLLLAFGEWLDNRHLNTMNGLWKSVTVEAWKHGFRTASLDPSNYLYFPGMAALCRGLDLLGVPLGQTWKQMAVVDSLFAGVATGFVYWMMRRLTGRRDVAAVTALVHLGGAFFLALSVSNEDILPSYTFVLAAMAMAAVWFAAPTTAQIVVVAAVFTLGWLTEWRLIFPPLPAFLLALAVSNGSLRQRALRVVIFVAAVLGTALLVVNRWEGHAGAVGLRGVLWTGKGVGSGWSGFSVDKLGLIASGMGEYWLGGRNLPDAHPLLWPGPEWSVAFALEMALLVAFLALLWARRRDPVLRTVAIIFLGTLGAGEVMNAYSQPQDPQMQINVMPWLTAAAGLLLAHASAGKVSRPAIVTAGAALAMLPLAYNIYSFSPLRGQDSRKETALRALAAASDPARTIYLYAGFESMVAWQFLEWSPNWEGVCGLAPAPQPNPRFKWIAVFSPLVHRPSMTKDEYATAVKAEIECAFDKGYRVLSSLAWSKSADALSDWMTPLNAYDYGPVLYTVLHGYTGQPVGGTIADNEGDYYEITRP